MNIKIVSVLAVAALVAMVAPSVTAANGGGSVNNKVPVFGTFDTMAILGGPIAGARNYNNPQLVEFSGTWTDANKACDMQTLKVEIAGIEVGSFTHDLTVGGGDCNVSSEPSYGVDNFKAWKSSPNTIAWKWQRTFAVTGTLTVTPSVKDEAAYQTASAITLVIQDKLNLFANPVDLNNQDLGALAKWGAWAADPGAAALGTNFVRITNSGVKADQAFTLDLSADFSNGLTGANLDSIPLASNIQYDCREGASNATPSTLGMGTPTWSTAASGSTGTLTFTATGKVFFCAYKIAALPSVLVDAAYSTTYTATAA